MVQKPKSRRSASTRKPVTIDLEASEVMTVPPESTEAGAGVPPAEPVAFDEKPETVTEVTETTAQAAETATGVDADARDAVEGGERRSSGGEAETFDAAPGAKAAAISGRGGHGLAWLGGGVIGGVVALLLAGGLQWAGVLPSMRSAEPVDLSPLQARIDELAGEVSGLQGASSGVPAEMSARVDAAESAVASVQQQTGDLQGELASVKEQLTALNQAISAGGAGESAGLEALTQRVSALETSIADLGSRLDGLAAAASGGEAEAALRSELATVEQSAKAAGDAVSSLRSDLGSLSSTVSETQSQVASLGERLAKVESDIAAGAGSRVAAAIAASALKSAADRGGSFMSELEAYASVSADQETVAALRDYAASGVPTQAQLVERFPAVANSIVSVANGLAPDAGIIDRLSASARSLVQVRPVGEVEGTEPGAVAARMEVALKSGDLNRAASEWDTLPEAAKTVSSDFMADVQARLKLDTLIAKVLSGAMSAGQPEAAKSE